MKKFDGDLAKRGIIRVGRGERGFVVQAQCERLVITAAHCLPRLPGRNPFLEYKDRTYLRLLSALGETRRLAAECRFLDRVGDIAVLAKPDEQWGEEVYEPYDTLVTVAVLCRWQIRQREGRGACHLRESGCVVRLLRISMHRL